MAVGGGGLLVLVVLSLLFGRDLVSDFAVPDDSSAAVALSPADSAREESMVQFVSFVLDDAQHTWRRVMPIIGGSYSDARLVLFRGSVSSACGVGQSAMGPFYCPADETIYLDLGFFEALDRRFGAPGDFAQAYVIAHEIGHHVQRLYGMHKRVRTAQQYNPGRANEASVRLELQADCYAGVWAHSTRERDLLERGDIEEGLTAAAAVGDDRIQAQTSGEIRPESFTHGTAKQRATWFRRGLASGDPRVCDTFGGGIRD